MEKLGGGPHLQEGVRAKRLDDLVDVIALREDAELSYYCMIINGNELQDSQQVRLTQAIAEDAAHGPEFAFKLLRDQRDLAPELRDRLFQAIVQSGDLTTCSLTLGRVHNLGRWEAELRTALSG